MHIETLTISRGCLLLANKLSWEDYICRLDADWPEAVPMQMNEGKGEGRTSSLESNLN